MSDDSGLEPVVLPNSASTVLSPSPDPGQPTPKRREEDTKSYSGEWALLIVALLTWAGTFFSDMAQIKTWSEMQTPAFVGTHMMQVVGVVVSVVAAKRIK